MSSAKQQVRDALRDGETPTRAKTTCREVAQQCQGEGDADVGVDMVLGYPAKSQLEPIRNEIVTELKRDSRRRQVTLSTHEDRFALGAVAG